MFTPKNIQGALEELYDLCDPDYMVDMLVNYSEEFDEFLLRFWQGRSRKMPRWFASTEYCPLLVRVSTIRERYF